MTRPVAECPPWYTPRLWMSSASGRILSSAEPRNNNTAGKPNQQFCRPAASRKSHSTLQILLSVMRYCQIDVRLKFQTGCMILTDDLDLWPFWHQLQEYFHQIWFLWSSGSELMGPNATDRQMAPLHNTALVRKFLGIYIKFQQTIPFDSFYCGT